MYSAPIHVRPESASQASKKSCALEPRPAIDPCGLIYGRKFRVGYDLFTEEHATETFLRSRFPGHFRGLPKSGGRDRVAATCRLLARWLWEALCIDEIRAWNNKVEPNHEELERGRNIEEALDEWYAAFNTKFHDALTKMPDLKKRDEPLKRDGLLASIARLYDETFKAFAVERPYGQ